MRFGTTVDKLLTDKCKAIVRKGRKPITKREIANRQTLVVDNKYPYLPTQADIFALDWDIIK